MKYFDIKWLSTALFIIGGTLVAFKSPYMKYAFPGFAIAHGILLYYFIVHHKSKPLIFQNMYFVLLNTTASYIWLFKG